MQYVNFAINYKYAKRCQSLRKKVIDVSGKNGGLIVDAGAIIDEVKSENVKAMIDFSKEYGMN